MASALALANESNFEPAGPSPSRTEVLARYRRLREISKVHHHKAMKLLSKSAILQQARRLGLSDGKRLIVGSMDEMTLAFDLAIHTAPPGRSRAIDRYARNLPPPGSDEALVLDAMRNARFALLLIERRHPVAGLVATDLHRDEEVWLVDVGLEMSLPERTTYATRYLTPDRFSMTAGVGMPVDRLFLADALEAAVHLLRKPRVQAIEDPRFAEALYRRAIAAGTMEEMEYVDPPTEGYAA